METSKTSIQAMVFERIRAECSPVDVSDIYDSMLDDNYQHESFFQNTHILPSKALKECDPIAYQTGLNDYVDCDESLTYIDGQYYDRHDVQEIKDAIIAEIEAVEGDEE